MKHVVFVLDAFGFFGGPERRAFRIAKGLKDLGYRVSIVSIMKSNDETVKMAMDEGIYAFSVTNEHNKALRSYRVDVFIKLRKALSRLKPDVVFTFEFLADYTTKMALLGKRLPIFTFIGSTTWKWEKKWHRRIFMESFAKRSKYYIVNSNNVRLNCLRVLPMVKDKIKLLYNPIDTDYFKPVSEQVRSKYRRQYFIDDKFVVGSVVRFYNPKGADVLIEAFYRSGVDAVLFLVGDGSLKDKLLEMVRNFKIEDRVIFAGAMEATPEIYGMFDVSVVPSQLGGFDNVVIESMACGIPTIATEATRIGEIAKDKEHLIICKRDAQSMARSIKLLYDNNELLAKLKINGRRFIKSVLDASKIVGEVDRWMNA